VGGGVQIIFFLGYSLVHYRNHQHTKGPSPQAQRSLGTLWQAGIQFKDSEEAIPFLAMSQGCPRRASDPVFMCETCQDKTMLELLSD